MRRGFKTEARDLARDIRAQLGLTQTDPLNPWRLAEHLSIPIVGLSDFGGLADYAIEYFSGVGRSVFSAVTIFEGPRRLIVNNDSHSPGRQASNVTHELSHGLLLHPPTPALDKRGCRYWNREIEDEANWLSGVLLIPDEAAISIVRKGIHREVAAAHYGVSRQMITFRINMSGAEKRVKRFRRRRY